MVRQRSAAGLDYLTWATELLQAARRANPTGGVWEAADLQWWWRRDQHADPGRQTFWFEGEVPVAAALITSWGVRFGCDVLAARHDTPAALPIVWPRLLEQLDALGAVPAEMAVRDDEHDLAVAAAEAGFRPTDEIFVETWMDAADRPAVAALPSGFRLATRAGESQRPHHMIGRNGAAVAERLQQCSLYRPDLDLVVYDVDDEVAAYGLFWADPVTRVGLVEPMRTEDRHQGRGLGRGVLTAGLERLAASGCTRLKVSYRVGNEASKRLYLGTGFSPGPPSRTYRRG